MFFKKYLKAKIVIKLRKSIFILVFFVLLQKNLVISINVA